MPTAEVERRDLSRHACIGDRVTMSLLGQSCQSEAFDQGLLAQLELIERRQHPADHLVHVGDHVGEMGGFPLFLDAVGRR